MNIRVSPQSTVVDAASIAKMNGCRLVYMDGIVYESCADRGRNIPAQSGVAGFPIGHGPTDHVKTGL